MHKLTIIVFAIGVLGLLVLAGCSNNSLNPASGNIVQTTLQELETKSTGSTGMGDVLVELTPHGVTDGKLEIDIAVNTHSVTLSDFDLKEITTLEFGGKVIKPTEAPNLAGHHSSGTLVFDVEGNIDAYTITIVGIPKVEQRTFTWGS